MDALQDDLPYSPAGCWITTDGARAHFKSRISLYWATQFQKDHKIKVHWWFDCPYHGKGECDGHGSVVKRKIRRFILKGNFGFIPKIKFLICHAFAAGCFVDNHLEAIKFINDHVRKSKAVYTGIVHPVFTYFITSQSNLQFCRDHF